ncbi:phosphatidylserine decarboxylase family protein [Winslowiella toletana]|uniref:phosphatidylserine decarboxylase family protein n=1 Tax=Winslowiella toletana TaxID=92490 RepID=UPI0028BD49B6|nr:phosphatidylserine decarboxylase family protein [Winslowiella toletana]WNN45479.1 phosphatidylserine decarboxylase family protein [Winslowiella toletana]
MNNEINPCDKTFTIGKWMPSDQKTLTEWLLRIMNKAENNDTPLLPAVQNFKDFIESDPKAYMFFNQMFDQVGRDKKLSPGGLPQVRDYHHMLSMINVIMTHAPDFDETGLVGCPFNALFDWSMATRGGWAGFINEKVNLHLKAILNEWGKFLRSADSAYVLSDDPKKGWFGKDALHAMPTFVEDFQCDPQLPHYGFHSWDDFFTRTLREGARPVAEPDNDAIIINACESAPYRVATDVQLRDKFWIKAQPYALQFMMDNDPLVSQFEGGTIYQAYLSALSYHRWHSPVSGRVVKTRMIEGTYYSESLYAGIDAAGPDRSQSYIAEIATRGLIFIEADNPDIGLMCVMAIGMAEVSTCEITAFEGQYVKKGDQLGMFHFGGSTHCLFFGPQVNIEFDLHGQVPGHHSHNIPVNAQIAKVGLRKG